MVKAVVFDLDDTLFLECDYIASGYKVVAKKIARDFCISENIINQHLIELSKISTDMVYQRLLSDLQGSYEASYINELVLEYRLHDPQIQLLPDSKKAINILKKEGYKLGIITDGYKDTQNKKIAKLGLQNLIDCIIVTDEYGREFWKPHEKAYRIMKTRLDVEYFHTVYVGDNPHKDFITARKLGLVTVYIQREKGLYSHKSYGKEYEADYKVNNMEEFLKLVHDVL